MGRLGAFGRDRQHAAPHDHTGDARSRRRAAGARRRPSRRGGGSTNVEPAPVPESYTLATRKLSSIRALKYPVVLSMSFFSPLWVCRP